MEEAKIREKVKEKLASGELPTELGAVVVIASAGRQRAALLWL
jgi:hypothetical protein